MAATLTSIREGLAANLAVLNGIQVSAYVLSNPHPPVIWVRPDPGDLIDYHQTMGNGLEHWHLVVEAFTGTSSDMGAQMKLDTLVESTGATSVKAALEADRTLTKRLQEDGSVVLGQPAAAQDLKVETAHGYAEYSRQDGSTTLLGCKWNVLVETSGS